MDFSLFVFIAIAAIVLGFVALGKWYPGSGADVVDWKPTRSVETEIQLEIDDVEQMLEAQNERRRRSGRAEITEEGMAAEVDAERKAMSERRESYRAGQDAPEA